MGLAEERFMFGSGRDHKSCKLIERKVTPPIGSVLQANPTPLVPIGGIGEKAQHLGIGINNTKTF